MTLIDEIDALEKLVAENVGAELQSTFRGRIFGIREKVEALEGSNAELVQANEVAEHRAHEFKVQNEELLVRNPATFHKEDVDLCAAIRAIVATINSNKQGICLPSNERILVEGLQVMVEDIKIRVKRRLGVSDTEVP